MFGWLIAAGVAGAVTYFEIDRIFLIPKGSPGRWAIRADVAAFVLVNSLLALALYALLNKAGILASIETWLRGLLIGAGYLSLVRLKFATVNEQPFGFEFFYDLAKEFAYRRINRRVIDARTAAAKKHGQNRSLADLATEANSHTNFDSLLSEEEKSEAKAWILRVITDDETEEGEKKLILADFIRSGSRTGHQ